MSASPHPRWGAIDVRLLDLLYERADRTLREFGDPREMAPSAMQRRIARYKHHDLNRTVGVLDPASMRPGLRHRWARNATRPDPRFTPRAFQLDQNGHMTLPWRAVGADIASRPFDPDNQPMFRGTRPLKKWSYLGVYGPEVQLCVGFAKIAVATQSFWAVHHRASNRFRDQSRLWKAVELTDTAVGFSGKGVRADLAIKTAGDNVEVVSRHRNCEIWTRKLPVQVTGTVQFDDDEFAIDSPGLIDDSAGHHARVTKWFWSAGAGTTTDGRAIVWNLVDGVHDAVNKSERTVWLDGVASEPPPVTFAKDLSSVSAGDATLKFTAEEERASHERLVIIESNYRQPFGTFEGVVPGGAALREGYGVMEDHDVRW